MTADSGPNHEGIHTVTSEVAVYVNWGRLIADCRCGDAREVEIGQRQMTCVDGHVSALVWPPNTPQIMAALNERTSDKRKNWFPRNHPLALVGGLPHGQSVRDLQEETEQGEAADAAMLADRRADLLGQLKELGVTPDEALVALKGV